MTNNKEYKHIQTGADLIDTNILQFLVENGQWIGEVIKENDTYYVSCMDTDFNPVNKIKITPSETLDWHIEILKKKDIQTTNTQMTDLEKLLKIYHIVEIFKDCYEQEVQPQLQSLYMTSDYEDLNTACGLLGELIGDDNLSKLTINKCETRNMLKNAYEACDILDNNVVDEAEDLKRALAELKTCYYVILNSTYSNTNTAQETLNKIFEVCEYGLQILSMMRSETEETYKKYYVNPYTDDTITNRIEQLTNTFNTLRPVPSEEKQIGDDTNENDA